jgi:hypothetical protein
MNIMGTRWRLAAVLLTAAVLTASCGNPRHVDEVVFVNPTDHPASVALRGEEGGRLVLGRVEAGQERRVGQVLDQGDTWTFVFSRGDQEEVVELDRGQLEDSGWRVEVPAALGAALDE